MADSLDEALNKLFAIVLSEAGAKKAASSSAKRALGTAAQQAAKANPQPGFVLSNTQVTNARGLTAALGGQIPSGSSPNVPGAATATPKPASAPPAGSAAPPPVPKPPAKSTQPANTQPKQPPPQPVAPVKIPASNWPTMVPPPPVNPAQNINTGGGGGGGGGGGSRRPLGRPGWANPIGWAAAAAGAGGQIGRGLGSAAIGAATGNPLAVVTGLTSAFVGATSAVKNYADSQVEASRNLAQFNGQIAASFAKFNLADLKRTQRMANATGGSTSGLLDSYTKLKDELAPIRQVTTTVMNQAAIAIIQYCQLATNFMNTMIEVTPLAKGIIAAIQAGEAGRKSSAARTFKEGFRDFLEANNKKVGK